MVLNLQNLGVQELSPMQQATHEAYSRDNRDIILLSPTGSGKTLAYLLPLIQSIDVSSNAVQAVIIVPSRELAIQTSEVLKKLKTPVRIQPLYGGRPAMEEHRLLNALTPHIIVATPGRLVDHLEKHNFEVHSIRTFVIDEFDKCLEQGFHDEMHHALSMLPNVSRRILLSATDARQIPDFVHVNHAVKLDFLSPDSSPDEDNPSQRITVYEVNSPQKDKLDTLYDLLCSLGDVQSIVFLNHRDAVERVGQFLRSRQCACDIYHGAMEQDHRERALFKFSNGTSNVLVATDLASRGLDMPDTDVIIHYHLPLNEQTFVHRNGRTARWKSEGRVFVILHEEERLPEYITSAEPYYIPSRLPSLPQPRMATLYIGKGKKDKLSKADVLGFLCKTGQLQSSQIGRIDIRDHHCYAAVERECVRTLLQKLENQKIKGIKTLFRIAK